MTLTQPIETRSVILKIVENNIVELIIKEKKTIEKEDVQDIYEMIREIAGEDGECLLLVNPEFGSSISKEARDFASKYQKEGKRIKAQAIIVNNLPHRLMANFFIKFHKPKLPIKMFSTYEKAEKWLLSYADK